MNASSRVVQVPQDSDRSEVESAPPAAETDTRTEGLALPQPVRLIEAVLSVLREQRFGRTGDVERKGVVDV
jgi:hypothetical protein